MNWFLNSKIRERYVKKIRNLEKYLMLRNLNKFINIKKSRSESTHSF